MKLLCALLLALIGMTSIANAQTVNPCNLVVCTTKVKYLSAATTNSTLVKAGMAAVYGIVAVNTTATIYFLKLYDKVSAPTCNSDTVQQTYPLQIAPSSIIIMPSAPIGFNAGLGFCLTALIADNDNTAAATGIAINFIYR